MQINASFVEAPQSPSFSDTGPHVAIKEHLGCIDWRVTISRMTMEGIVAVKLKAKQAFFSEGTSADSVFYLQKGRAKLTVVSRNGKEATITLLNPGDFVGEESIASAVGLRLATATALVACTALNEWSGTLSLRSRLHLIKL